MNAKYWVNSTEELWKHNFKSVVSRSVHIIIWCKQLWVWGLPLEKILAFFSAWRTKQRVVGLSVFYSCEAERWVSPSFTATVLNTGPWCEHMTCPVPPELENLGTSREVQGSWPSLPVRQCFAAFIATTAFLSLCSEASYTLFQLVPCVNPLFCYFKMGDNTHYLAKCCLFALLLFFLPLLWVKKSGKTWKQLNSSFLF